MSILLVILIVVFASASSFIPSVAKSLVDNRRRGLKRIKVGGWLTIICYFITIGLTYVQFQYNEDENKRKEFKADSTLSARDVKQRRAYDSSLSQMKNKFDTSSIKIANAFGEALGKYGLKLDSANNKIVKVVRDSSKTKIILSDSPILIVGNDGISFIDCKAGRCTYNVKFSSRDAGSTSFSLQTSLIAVDSLGYYYRLGDLFFLSETDFIPKDASYTTGFEIDEKLHFEELYLDIKGSYKNTEKTKTYNIDQILAYNKKSKVTSILTEIGRKKVYTGLRKTL